MVSRAHVRDQCVQSFHPLVTRRNERALMRECRKVILRKAHTTKRILLLRMMQFLTQTIKKLCSAMTMTPSSASNPLVCHPILMEWILSPFLQSCHRWTVHALPDRVPTRAAADRRPLPTTRAAGRARCLPRLFPVVSAAHPRSTRTQSRSRLRDTGPIWWILCTESSLPMYWKK